MISVTFVILSIAVFIFQLKLASAVPLKSVYVFIFMLSCVLTGLLHYRVFLNGTIFGIELDNLLVSFFSLIAFLVTCIVPVTKLSKRRKLS